MERLIKHLIVVSTVISFSINLSFAQATVAQSKVYSGKAKFFMTEINFKNFKAHENCVGLIMFQNISKKTLRIAAVTKESGSVDVTIKSQKIRPHQKGILTYTLINPPQGEFNGSSLIFFKEFNDPVKVDISGNFL